MKILLIIAIVFLLHISTTAQTSLQQGYVITLKGDTLNGYLKVDDEISLNKGVEFKKELNNNWQFFDTKDIQAFHFLNGVFYKSLNYNDISGNPSTHFAKTIIEGYYSAYNIYGKRQTIFYYTD